MSNTLKNVVLCICIFLFLGILIDTFTGSRDKKDIPVSKYNSTLPLVKKMPLDDLGWRLAMQENSDPKEMRLYLTKDFQMIWVSNDIADKYGRIKNLPITTSQQYLNYHMGLEPAYVEIISYANVDFSNITRKQEKNLSLISQEVFSHKTRWLLGKNYEEIMSERLPSDKVRDFCIDDIHVLKKGNNICIVFNGETINPYYELEIIDQSLESRGFSSKARKTFLSMNKPK
jgi:hypothetical protein